MLYFIFPSSTDQKKNKKRKNNFFNITLFLEFYTFRLFNFIVKFAGIIVDILSTDSKTTFPLNLSSIKYPITPRKPDPDQRNIILAPTAAPASILLNSISVSSFSPEIL